MTMYIKPGIKLIKDLQGDGLIAEKGDTVIYNLRCFLNQGDEIPINTVTEQGSAKIEAHQSNFFRIREGSEVIDFTCRIGKRDAIAGIEYSLVGMKEGGFRKIKISPHLGYRDTGVPDRIPHNAVLICHIWLERVTKEKAEQ